MHPGSTGLNTMKDPCSYSEQEQFKFLLKNTGGPSFYARPVSTTQSSLPVIPVSNTRFDEHLIPDRFRDVSCLCDPLGHHGVSRLRPFDHLDSSLRDLALVPKLPESFRRKYQVEKRHWLRIVLLYCWLDPKRRGYIDVTECSEWLLKLWYLREAALVGKWPAPWKQMDTKSLTSRCGTSQFSLQDILLCALRGLAHRMSSRGVIEMDQALWTMKEWMDLAASAGNRNCSEWVRSILSDDPEISPLAGLGAPDARLLDFYAPVPDPEPTDGVVHCVGAYEALKENRRRERAARLRKAANQCIEKHERNDCPHTRPEPEKIQQLGALVPKNTKVVDEVLRYQFPALDIRTQRTTPSKDAWRVHVNHLLKEYHA